MNTKGWVKVTFSKEFIEGDRTLFDKITQPEHGIELHHTFGWNYMVYGDRAAYDARNTIEVKRNPDDRYKRQTA